MKGKYDSSKLFLAVLMVFSVTGMLFQAPWAVAPVARHDLDPSDKAEALETYGQLPMSFEANQGQADAQVKFLSRGGGYRLFLTANEAVLYVSKPAASKTSYQTDLTPMSADPDDIQAIEHTALRMRLVGANPQPVTVGPDPLQLRATRGIPTGGASPGNGNGSGCGRAQHLLRSVKPPRAVVSDLWHQIVAIFSVGGPRLGGSSLHHSYSRG